MHMQFLLHNILLSHYFIRKPGKAALHSSVLQETLPPLKPPDPQNKQKPTQN